MTVRNGDISTISFLLYVTRLAGPVGVMQDVVQYSISKIGTRRLATPKPERCRGAALHSQVAYRSVLFKRPLRRVWTAKLYVIKNTMST